MKYILHTIIAVIFFGLLACDIIDSNYREQPKNIDPPEDNVRKVLLEEFTGFKCGYCPPANQTANDIYHKYKGRIVLVAIHAGSLAVPDAKNTYDFRTEVGNEINNAFSIKANPIGVVNRIAFEDVFLLKQDKWELAASKFFEEQPKMLISIENSYSLSNDSTISTNVSVKYLENSSPDHRLSVFVIEDSIVQYQKWYNHTPTDIYDYVHNHVLRASMNGTWGVTLGNVEKDKTIEKLYKITIPKDDTGNFLWRPEKIKIVAFVHNLSAGTYEVLQVEEKALIK